MKSARSTRKRKEPDTTHRKNPRDVDSLNQQRMRRKHLHTARTFGYVAAPFLLILLVSLWEHSQWVDRQLVALQEIAVMQSSKLGLNIRDVEVSGTRYLQPGTVRESVYYFLPSVADEYPLYGFSLTGLAEHLKKIGWIKHVSVSRELPDVLHIHIIEREPFAIWQVKGKLTLIDRDGVVITDKFVEKFPSLLLLVGADAGVNAAELFRVIRTQPELAERVISAVRVGGRRWNVVLNNGIEIKLPERDPEAAWLQLALLQKQQKMLARDIKAIDMRLEDRLFIQKKDAPKKATQTSPQKIQKDTQ